MGAGRGRAMDRVGVLDEVAVLVQHVLLTAEAGRRGRLGFVFMRRAVLELLAKEFAVAQAQHARAHQGRCDDPGGQDPKREPLDARIMADLIQQRSGSRDHDLTVRTNAASRQRRRQEPFRIRRTRLTRMKRLALHMFRARRALQPVST